MADVANLVIKVDSTGVNQASQRLDVLVRQGKKAEASTGSLGNAATGASKGFSSVAKQIAGVVGLTAGIGTVTAAAIRFARASSEAASAAEEINAKFEAVFKGQADDVREWAEEFSDSVGRATTDQLEFLGIIQDTLVPLGFARDAAADMSKEVVALATDLGSFNNMPTEQVIRGIQSALVGNTETLRRFGVVANQAQIEQEALNSGLWDGEGALTAQEKAAAILNLTMAGTVDAQGDALRTADSFANTQRRVSAEMLTLKENVGQLVNEGFKPLLIVFGDILENVTDAQERMLALRDARGTDAEDRTFDQELTLLNERLAELQRQREDLERAGGSVDESVSNLMGLAGVVGGGDGRYHANLEELDSEIASIREKIGVIQNAQTETERLADIESERASQAEEHAERELERLSAVEEAYRAAREEIVGILEDAKTPVEELREQIAYLEGFRWETGSALEADRLAALNELYRQLGVEMRNVYEGPTFEEDSPLVRDRSHIEEIARAYQDRLVPAAEAYRREMQTLEMIRPYLSSEEYAQALDNLREKYREQQDAMWHFKETLETLGKQFAEGSLTAGLDVMNDIGRSLAGAEDGVDSFGEAMARMGAAMLNILPQLMLTAGLRLIAQGQIPLGLAFVFGAGTVAVGAGFANYATSENALGNVYDQGGLVPFAKGGVVNKPTVFPFANGVGLMGEAGPEAIMPLKRGADGALGVSAAGAGSNVNVVIHNHSGEPVETRERNGSNGRELEVFIGKTVKQQMAQGGFDSVMAANYGVKRKGVG